MINRIFNWTAGSFFRTLGRFVFYGLITAIIVFLFSIFNAKAAVTSYNRGYYYVTGSDGSYITSDYVFGSSYFSLPEYSRVTYWFLEFSSYDITWIPGQTYTAYLYFDFNNTSYAWVQDGTNLSLSVNCVSTPNEGASCTNYVTTFTDNYINGNSLVVEFDFIAPELLDSDYFYISLNNTSSNQYALGYRVSSSVSFRFNRLSYSLSSGSVSPGESTIIDQNETIINQNDETNDKLDETNEELGNMNDYIQDDTSPTTDDIDMDSLGTVSGLLPAGPVDSLLNIPFTFLSVLTSSMGGVCVPITGTFVFDSTLSIPCFDSFYDEVPDYLMNFINLIPSGFILIMYFKHLYKKVERAVSLQTTTDDEWGVI